MLRALAPAVLATELFISPLAVTAQDYTLVDKSQFLTSPLSAYTQVWELSTSSRPQGLGLFSVSGDDVYESASDLPRDVPDDFTAFLVSGVVPVPVSDDPRISSEKPRCSFLPSARLSTQPVPLDSSTYSVVALRCVYYNGSVVPASVPCPIFVRIPAAVGGPDTFAVCFFYLEGVKYPSYSPSIEWGTGVFTDYLVPCFPSASGFTPVNPDIDGDTTFGTLYQFGQLLVGDASNVAGILNFKIFGYPLYQLLLTTGFYLVAGWTVLRFIVP